MKSIILIGYMGAGKSTIGKILAEKKQIPFFDTDIGIEEKQGRKISEIFRHPIPPAAIAQPSSLRS